MFVRVANKTILYETYCVNAENGSDNIQIEGLVVADPKYYGIRLVGTRNTISFAKVIGGWVYNCDGISAFAGSTVSKCFIWANDDAIKAYRDSLTWSDVVSLIMELLYKPAGVGRQVVLLPRG